MKLLLLFFILPFVQNVNRKARSSNYIKERLDAIRKNYKYPKLRDVLPNLVKKTSLDYDTIPEGAIVKNVSIDIDKINVNKIRKRMNAIADLFEKDGPKLNISRRQSSVDFGLGLWAFKKASDQMMRRKCADLMLQLLYMARHKITRLEHSRYFSTTNTAFRIAYTFRKVNRIYVRMMRYLTFQTAKAFSYADPHPHIILHGKITRLHVDYNYMWMVMMRVHEVFTNATSVKKDQLEFDRHLAAKAKRDAKKNASKTAEANEQEGPKPKGP